MRADDEPIEAGPRHAFATLARLWRTLRVYWPQIIPIYLLSAVEIGLDLAPPYLTKLAIDGPMAEGDVPGVLRIGAVVLAVAAGSFALTYVQSVWIQMTAQRVVRDLRNQCFAHVQRISLSELDRRPRGDLLSTIVNDTGEIDKFVIAALISVWEVVLLVAIAVAMMLMDWRLAVISFALLPGLILVLRWYLRVSRATLRTERSLLGRLSAHLQESLSAVAVVQLFRGEARIRDGFQDRNRAHTTAAMRAYSFEATFTSFLQFYEIAGMALIVLFGGARVLEGALTLGSLGAFLQYSRSFTEPLNSLSFKLNELQPAIAAADRVFDLLDLPTASEHRGTRTLPAELEGRLAAENVSLSYDGESWALRGVSFTIEPGQKVAFVGATGAGKSSILSLALGFYQAQEGRFTIDGIDVRELDADALRSQVGLVLQDVHLVRGTIADNIRFGAAIPDDAVRKAAVSVGADRFIAGLPRGYDTELLAGGVGLSAGQRQLIAFARALVRNPRVLLLDEATASLDTDSELMVERAMNAAMRDRTAVVIAHRLSTVQSMDRILVFQRGRLVEEGSHEELMQAGAYYRTLYDTQLAGRAPGSRDSDGPVLS